MSRRLCVTDVPVPFRPFVTDTVCNGRSGSVLVPFRQFRGIPFLPFCSDEIGPVPRNCYPLRRTLKEDKVCGIKAHQYCQKDCKWEKLIASCAQATSLARRCEAPRKFGAPRVPSTDQ